MGTRRDYLTMPQVNPEQEAKLKKRQKLMEPADDGDETEEEWKMLRRSQSGVVAAWDTINMDPKTKLNTALQKKTGRPVKKVDVVYETTRAPEGGYQCRLQVRHLNLEVNSPINATNKRDAEKFAACQALIHMATNGDWVGDIPTNIKKAAPTAGPEKGAKPTVSDMDENGMTAVPAPHNMPTRDPVLKRSIPQDTAPVLAFKYTAFTGPFGMLKQLIQEALGRPFNNSDMIVTLEHTGKGFCAHISLPPLSLKMKGATLAKREDAERSASAVACRKVQEACMKHNPVLRYPLGGEAPNIELAKKTDGTKTELEKQAAAPAIFIPEEVLRAEQAKQEEHEPITEILGEVEEWRSMRLERIGDGDDLPGPTDFGYWYGQMCLVCLKTVNLQAWDIHSKGSAHVAKYETLMMKKRNEAPRPTPTFKERLLGTEYFMRTAGWHAPSTMLPHMCPSILTVGEMDWSFSLAVARLRPRGAHIVATSHLKRHDPKEPEIHPQDDAERHRYRRFSLPSMGGTLFKNMEEFKDRGGQVVYSVDAMDLEGTLRVKRVEGGFANIIFPLPRATLQRSSDPRNSRLLRNFFLSCRQHGFLLPKGQIQLIMLSSQYEEWDIACMAADAGMYLAARAEMPVDFYQAREVSGKPWVPIGAELLCFRVKGE